jgi:uncharacterized protein (DUF983 family)
MQQSITNNRTSNRCLSGLALLQVVLGILLVVASAYGYSLFQHLAVTLPAMMGATLIFSVAKSALICRDNPLFRGNHRSATGMLD